MSKNLAFIAAIEKTALGFLKPKPITTKHVKHDKSSRAAGIIKAHFAADHQKNIARIVALMLDVPEDGMLSQIAATEAGEIPPKGTAFVSTDNPNSHNYPVGNVLFSLGKTTEAPSFRACYFAVDGQLTYGNNLYLPSRHPSTRLAREDEIVAECDRLRALTKKGHTLTFSTLPF